MSISQLIFVYKGDNVLIFFKPQRHPVKFILYKFVICVSDLAQVLDQVPELLLMVFGLEEIKQIVPACFLVFVFDGRLGIKLRGF